MADAPQVKSLFEETPETQEQFDARVKKNQAYLANKNYQPTPDVAPPKKTVCPDCAAKYDPNKSPASPNMANDKVSGL